MSRKIEPESSWAIALLPLPLAMAALLVGTSWVIGQEKSPARPRNVIRTIAHDGVKRTYHVHLPPRFELGKTLHPAVIGLHGGGGDALRFAKGSTGGTLLRAAEKRGVVLILPEGLNGHWNDGRTEVFREKKGPDDVGFLGKVIDDAVRTFHLDPDRISATGISNGGFMSLRLAVDLSEKIAAVAPVAAQMTPKLAARKPKTPVSVLFMCGTADPIVPYGGGVVRVGRFGRGRGRILSVDDSVKYWRNVDGCNSASKLRHLKDKDPKDGTTIDVLRYTGGRQGTMVALYKVVGGGHAWPRPNAKRGKLRTKITGRVSHEIDAGAVILDFLLAHRRNQGKEGDHRSRTRRRASHERDQPGDHAP